MLRRKLIWVIQCVSRLNLKNDTLQNPQNPGLNPIINTSKITNSVIIKSDDILVLGGLISNSNNENINKVPILGDAANHWFFIPAKNT